MAPSLLATIYNSLSLGNVLLLLLLLLMLHYLMVFYEFRNMPPGPRLTTLPALGNVFSLDHKAEKLSDAFKRSVQWITIRNIYILWFFLSQISSRAVSKSNTVSGWLRRRVQLPETIHNLVINAVTAQFWLTSQAHSKRCDRMLNKPPGNKPWFEDWRSRISKARTYHS